MLDRLLALLRLLYSYLLAFGAFVRSIATYPFSQGTAVEIDAGVIENEAEGEGGFEGELDGIPLGDEDPAHAPHVLDPSIPHSFRRRFTSRQEMRRQKRRDRKAQRKAFIEAETRRHQQRRDREEERLASRRTVSDEKKNLARQHEKKQREKDFDQWAHLFETVDTGDTSTPLIDSNDPLRLSSTSSHSDPTLSDFVSFVSSRRIVTLQELSSRFGLLLSECADRLRDLCEMGRLQGVLDERGKFICVSDSQMEKLADFIIETGRLSIPELQVKAGEVLSNS